MGHPAEYDFVEWRESFNLKNRIMTGNKRYSKYPSGSYGWFPLDTVYVWLLSGTCSWNYFCFVLLMGKVLDQSCAIVDQLLFQSQEYPTTWGGGGVLKHLLLWTYEHQHAEKMRAKKSDQTQWGEGWAVHRKMAVDQAPWWYEGWVITALESWCKDILRDLCSMTYWCHKE